MRRYRVVVMLQELRVTSESNGEYINVSHQSLMEADDRNVIDRWFTALCSFIGSMMRFAQELKDV